MQRPGSSSRGRAGGSLAQERRSVREQTPLEDRFSETLAARRSGIEEAVGDARDPRHGDGRRAASDRTAEGNRNTRFERFDGTHRYRLQRLATGSGRTLARFWLRWYPTRAAIVRARGNRIRGMPLDRRQAESAVIRDSEPRSRGQRYRCPTKGHRSTCAQHGLSLP